MVSEVLFGASGIWRPPFGSEASALPLPGGEGGAGGPASTAYDNVVIQVRKNSILDDAQVDPIPSF